MIISRATPAALLMHTAGLGKSWAHTAGCPLCIPSGTQCPGHGQSSPSGRALGTLHCSSWGRSSGGPEKMVLLGCCSRSREIWLLSALPGTASSLHGQLQEIEIPQIWCHHPSLAEGGRHTDPVWSRTLSYQPRGWQQAQDKAAGAQGCTGTCGTKAVPITQRCWVPAWGVPVTPPALPSTGSSPLQVKLGGKWDGVPREMTPKQRGIRSHCLRDPPQEGGWGHWALVAAERSAHDGVFGSHSILCLFHSSPSSFSPFKALRLCRTETISWLGPRTWLLCSAQSWALSACQPWQETFAIPP